jgi:hypothetical protein
MKKIKELIGTKYVNKCKCGEYKFIYSQICKKCNIIKQSRRLLKLTQKRKGIKLSKKLKNKISKATKKAITIHHKDGNHFNNKKSNRLLIPMRFCSKIHYDAYKYLVEIKLVDKYLKWFENRHNIKIRGLNENS